VEEKLWKLSIYRKHNMSSLLPVATLRFSFPLKTESVPE